MESTKNEVDFTYSTTYESKFVIFFLFSSFCLSSSVFVCDFVGFVIVVFAIPFSVHVYRERHGEFFLSLSQFFSFFFTTFMLYFISFKIMIATTATNTLYTDTIHSIYTYTQTHPMRCSRIVYTQQIYKKSHSADSFQ